MQATRSAEAPTRIVLTATPEVCDKFCLLTGSGFWIHARLGCSVRQLLCDRLGIRHDYLDHRIQTIFLNGQVVDDPDAAMVAPASTIALSAAMPGVAGAMLRKNSRYAPMRSRLSYGDSNSAPPPNVEGDVMLKLFNLLQRELGPPFLRRGIRVSGRALGDLLERRWEAFRAGMVAVEVSGEPVSPDALRNADWTDREVLLTVGSSNRKADDNAAAPTSGLGGVSGLRGRSG